MNQEQADELGIKNKKTKIIKISMSKKGLEKVKDKSGKIIENWQDKVDTFHKTKK